MWRISLVAKITLCASLFLAAHKVTPLNVKTGLWEVTTTTTASEKAMLPAALLEKLNPEERARVEERMKARKADAQKTTITKQCLTEKQLERGMPFHPVRNSCNWTVVSSTGHKVAMQAECVDNGVKMEGAVSIETLGPEEAKGSVQFLTGSENSAPSLTSTFTAKWIGPECKSPR
jgi:hypothetical protein